MIAEDLNNMINMATPMMAMMKNMNAGKDSNDDGGKLVAKIVLATREFAQITALFSGDYEGGDFCQGLLTVKEAKKIVSIFTSDTSDVSTDAMFQ